MHGWFTVNNNSCPTLSDTVDYFRYLGIPGLITADMVKEGVAVIDVGINRIKDEATGKFKLVGDVDFKGKWNINDQEQR